MAGTGDLAISALPHDCVIGHHITTEPKEDLATCQVIARLEYSVWRGQITPGSEYYRTTCGPYLTRGLLLFTLGFDLLERDRIGPVVK